MTTYASPLFLPGEPHGWLYCRRRQCQQWFQPSTRYQRYCSFACVEKSRQTRAA